MAKPDHTSVEPEDARIPTNPLARPYWTLAEADPDQQDTANLAGLTVSSPAR